MDFLKKSYLIMSIIRWFDSDAGIEEYHGSEEAGVEWLCIAPSIVLHVTCLGVIWADWSWTAAAVAGGLYVIRMFAITGFYHRYVCHKAFTANRFWQSIFAILGNYRYSVVLSGGLLTIATTTTASPPDRDSSGGRSTSPIIFSFSSPGSASFEISVLSQRRSGAAIGPVSLLQPVEA